MAKITIKTSPAPTINTLKSYVAFPNYIPLSFS